MFAFEVVILLQRVFFRGAGFDGSMMLIQEFQDEIAEVLMNLNPLIEVVNVEAHRTGKVLFQSEQVEGLGSRCVYDHKSSMCKRSQEPVRNATVDDLNQANVTNVHARHLTLRIVRSVGDLHG